MASLPMSEIASTNGEQVSVVVKNTFIDFGGRGAERLPRRSSSYPPSIKSESEDTIDLSPALIGRRSPTATPNKAREEDEDGALSDHMAAASTVPSTQAESQMPLSPEGLTPTAIDAYNPRLNSEAKPFQPRVPRSVLVQGLQPAAFSEMLKNTVMTLAAMISAASHHVGVKAQVIEHFQGWRVDLEVAPPAFIAKVLDQAKATLLLLAERSTHVYVMGYRGTPFQEDAAGFQATLGIMQDQSLACWDIFSTGYCRRGSCCRWQHPACMKSLAVVAKPALSG